MEETINPNECRICGCTKWRLAGGVPVCATCYPDPEEVDRAIVTPDEVAHK